MGGGSGSSTTGPGAFGDPVTMAANNQQHIFYRALQLIHGPDNPLVHVFWDPNSGLTAETWAGGGSPTNAPGAAGDPATMVWNSEQHIFYRDTAGNIQHVFWDPNSGEHLDTPWAGGSGTGPAAAGDPATMVADNKQHIFYRDTAGNIQHVFWDPNSPSKRTVEVWASGAGSATTGPAAAGNPTTLVWNSQQHIFYRDTAGNIQNVWWDPTSGRQAEQWAGPGPNGMGNFGEFYLKNFTEGWSTKQRLEIGYGATTGQEAEWIMERPTIDQSLSALANYGTAQFADTSAASPSTGAVGYVCCDSTGLQLNMTSDGTSTGNLLSSASSPNSTTVDLTWHDFN
jgi:Peptidase A4 family/Repeat of unknown function (DUF346)